MKQIEVLSDAVLVEVEGKRQLCKAILFSARGGYLVSYLDNDGIEVKAEPLYKSPFKDIVKSKNVLYLIVSTYRDGEIREIIGYTNDEKKAEKKVNELKNDAAFGNYTYKIRVIEKL